MSLQRRVAFQGGLGLSLLAAAVLHSTPQVHAQQGKAKGKEAAAAVSMDVVSQKVWLASL